MVTADTARSLLAKHGEMPPQAASEWTGSIPLPACIEAFYKDVGPLDITIEQFGNPFFIPRLAGLWEMQTGYRWNASGEVCEDWCNEWIAIAHEGDAVLICDCRTGGVLHEVHGCGTSRPKEVFPDLNTMAACLASLGELVISAGSAFTDLDSVIRPEYVAKAVARLREFLPSDAEPELVLAELGWIG